MQRAVFGVTLWLLATPCSAAVVAPAVAVVVPHVHTPIVKVLCVPFVGQRVEVPLTEAHVVLDDKLALLIVGQLRSLDNRRGRLGFPLFPIGYEPFLFGLCFLLIVAQPCQPLADFVCRHFADSHKGTVTHIAAQCDKGIIDHDRPQFKHFRKDEYAVYQLLKFIVLDDAGVRPIDLYL